MWPLFYLVLSYLSESLILEERRRKPLRNKRLLTLDDLVVFCENNNYMKFNAKEVGYDIYV